MIFRFGTSSRKELKRMDWPGPGKYEAPTYTDDGRKTKLPDRILDKEKIEKERRKIYAKDDGLGQGNY